MVLRKLVFAALFSLCTARSIFSFWGTDDRPSPETNCSKPADPEFDQDHISLNQAVASGSDFKIYEYRVPMPMTVEEFDIGRNFMIDRLNEREGDGAGGKAVEFVLSETANHSTYGRGQHSLKRYNIAQRMPSWIRSLVSAPLVLSEHAWNFYPLTIAILRFPLLSKFRLRIQTMHLNGTGHENAHQVTDRRAADTETPDPGAAFYICSPHRSHCAPQAHQNTLLRHFFTCSASMLLHAQTRSRTPGDCRPPTAHFQ